MVQSMGSVPPLLFRVAGCQHIQVSCLFGVRHFGRHMCDMVDAVYTMLRAAQEVLPAPR